MPEYLYPGVYVEEIDTGNKPIEGVSTSTCGFLGIAERGPTSATLITSFDDYTRAFGSYVKDANGTDHYLAYSVEGFFQNGGQRCFVQRVAHYDPVTAANSAARAEVALPNLTLWAIGPGMFGNNIAYQVSPAGLADPTLFKLTVSYWEGTPSPDLMSSPDLTEVYDNLSATTTASTFFESEINGASNLVVIKQSAAGGRPANNSQANLQVSANGSLSPTQALTAGKTLILAAGAGAAAPTVTFTVNAAGPIKTVADLMTAVNADTKVGAKAYLDLSRRFNVLDPQGRGNITVTGTLTVAGADLGAFAATTQAGPPLLLTGGSDGSGPNSNLQVGASAGIVPGLALADGETITLTSGATVKPFVVNAAAGPIKLVSDLITAINADPFGATASLDAAGHFNILDKQNRGNLTVTDALAGAGGTGALGAFATAPTGGSVQLSLADFTGFDPDPFTIPALAATSTATKSGLLGLGDVDEISLLCCPEEFYYGTANFQIAGLLQQQCETLKDRFAILEAPSNARPDQTNTPSVNSEYAAYYFPWLVVTNPISGVNLLAPPCGHIAGIYARSDTDIGVQKDPANEVISGIVQLQLPINNQQQSILNPVGVNCLRYFTGAGNLVWGGRTTSNDPDWKYINVRRIFIFVETSIQRGTQWVVFDINSDPTWRRVVRSVSDFLTSLWRDGVLQGATKDEAFFVRCDTTTMTQTDIDNGRLICVIGIAPVKPAEFVIFRIGQWYGGSDVTEL